MCFSGGRDSTAMLIKMIEMGYNIDNILFADTGMEFPEMYDHIHKIEKYINMKIEFRKPKVTWDEWFYGKFTRGKYEGRIRGFPYVVNSCWANRELKAKPLDSILTENAYKFIGIAYNEISRTKRKLYGYGNFIFPLVEWGWTERDCSNYLKKINLENPLYEKFSRTGCWCCPKQSFRSLKSLCLWYPDLWEKLKKYELDSPHGFKPNFSLQKYEECILKTNNEKLEKYL